MIKTLIYKLKKMINFLILFLAVRSVLLHGWRVEVIDGFPLAVLQF